MLTPEEMNRMFPKRPASGAEPSGQRKKKKKKVTNGPQRHQSAQDPGTHSAMPNIPASDSPPTAPEEEETVHAAVDITITAEQNVPTPTGISSRTASTQSVPGDPNPSASTERRSGSRIPHGIEIDPSESATSDPELARRLVTLMIVPEDEAELRSRPSGEILSRAYTTMIASAHNLLLMDKMIADGRRTIRSLRADAAKAEANQKAILDAAQEAARTAEDRERNLRDEIARLNSEKAKMSRDMEERRNLFDARHQEFLEVQSALEDSRSLLRANENALSSAQSELLLKQMEVDAAKESNRLAEERIERAEQSAAESIDKYKESAEHKAALIEAGQSFYVTGFNRCKGEVGEVFPTLDLSTIIEPVFDQGESGSESEDDDEEEEPNLESAPAEIPPTTGVPTAESDIMDLTEEVPALGEGTTEEVSATMPTGPTEEATQSANEPLLVATSE